MYLLPCVPSCIDIGGTGPAVRIVSLNLSSPWGYAVRKIILVFSLLSTQEFYWFQVRLLIGHRNQSVIVYLTETRQFSLGCHGCNSLFPCLWPSCIGATSNNLLCVFSIPIHLYSNFPPGLGTVALVQRTFALHLSHTWKDIRMV